MQNDSIHVPIPNNWIPRQDQWALWEYLQTGGKRAVEVAHRRWGKDDVALHFTATMAMQNVGNYWHMLPQYNQARKVIWDAINPKTAKRRIDEAFPEEIRAKTRRQEMSIEFTNGSFWQLVGSDNYNAYVGSPPIGIVLSEWAVANPMAWAYLAPILEENQGWALFIYTSRGNNHGRTTYEHAVKKTDWYSEKLTAEQTPVFSSKQLANIKEEYIRIFGRELGTGLYEQEYMCSWEGAILGAYLAAALKIVRKEDRITAVPHMPGIEVDTFWDLGVDNSMTIWFMQPVGKSFNFIDYYESSGYGLEHYAKALRGDLEKAEHRKKYVYGNHWMPHDANQREMTNSEIAKSRKEVAEALGIKPIQVVQRARNMDTIIQVHIPAMNNILAQCWFDEQKCSDGLKALDNYRTEYDEEKKKLGNKPLQDWSIHGADGFRTFAVGYSKLPEINIPGIPKGPMPQPQPGGWMIQ